MDRPRVPCHGLDALDRDSAAPSRALARPASPSRRHAARCSRAEPSSASSCSKASSTRGIAARTASGFSGAASTRCTTRRSGSISPARSSFIRPSRRADAAATARDRHRARPRPARRGAHRLFPRLLRLLPALERAHAAMDRLSDPATRNRTASTIGWASTTTTTPICRSGTCCSGRSATRANSWAQCGFEGGADRRMGAIFGFVDVNAPLYGPGSLGAKPARTQASPQGNPHSRRGVAAGAQDRSSARSAAKSDSRDN